VGLRAPLALRLRGWRPDDRVQKGAIAIAMAALTFLAAGVATLQAGAATSAASAQRAADQLHDRAEARSNEVQAETAREYLLYRHWYEQGTRAGTARERAAGATDDDERAALAILADVEARLGAWLEGRGALFSEAYRDPVTHLIDFAGYAARSAAEATRLGEQAAREDEAAGAYAAIASGHVTLLTVVAVGLFFLGLATTLAGRRRAMFAALGASAALVAMGAAAGLALQPVHRVPDAAIEAYVRSTVELGRVGPGVGDEVIAGLVAAGSAAQEATTIDPAYAAARRQAAAVAAEVADRLAGDPGGDRTVARTAAADAIERWTAILRADPLDGDAWSTLAGLRYLAGDAESSLAAADASLGVRPGAVAGELDRGLALLALKRPDDAAVAVDRALAGLAGLPRGEAMAMLGDRDRHLGRLLERRPAAELGALRTLRTRLREASVALRVLDGRAPRTGMPVVAVRNVGTITIDRETGAYATALVGADGVVQGGAAGFLLDLAAAGVVPDGAVLSIRAWIDGVEDPSFRFDRPWAGDGPVELTSPYGAAGLPVVSGRYEIELYLDGVRVGERALVVTGSPTPVPDRG
jgi:hypothetical protein